MKTNTHKHDEYITKKEWLYHTHYYLWVFIILLIILIIFLSFIIGNIERKLSQKADRICENVTYTEKIDYSKPFGVHTPKSEYEVTCENGYWMDLKDGIFRTNNKEATGICIIKYQKQECIIK